jgi:hypothetical protein
MNSGGGGAVCPRTLEIQVVSTTLFHRFSLPFAGLFPRTHAPHFIILPSLPSGHVGFQFFRLLYRIVHRTII